MSHPEAMRVETPSEATTARRPWAWTAVACVLLGLSGFARAMQDRRHRVEASYTESSPFPLKELPAQLGAWKLTAGGERTLDDLTMRITGASDHILRTYVDELTGVNLVVLVLFGPAEPVMPHTPEICYPSGGYSLAGELTDRVIESEGGMTSRFRSAVYAKANGRAMLREEVYYSFRLEGQWAPDAGSGRKFPRRNPSVFKVQVQRRVAEGERRDRDDPIEQFLGQLVPAIEQRISSAPQAARPSMGGVRPGANLGEPMEVLALAAPRPLQAERPLGGRAMGHMVRGAGQAAREERGATDHADQEQDRRQVDAQGHLDRHPYRITGLGSAEPRDEDGPARGRILRQKNHPRHSFC